MTIAAQGLHVIHGDCAGGCFKQAFRGAPGLVDRVLIDQDTLSCGPAPFCESLEQWGEMRLGFWSGLDATAPPWGRHNPLRNLERLKAADAIYLWIGTSVDDQLMVAYVVHLLDRLGGAPERISLVQFVGFDKGPRIMSVGMLNPERMLAHPAPQGLTPEMIAGYRQAWEALSSSTPSRLVEFCAGDDGAVPYLRQAMRCLLRLYPDRRTGLAYWDRELLRYVAEYGPRAARIIGYCIGHSTDDPHHIGDLVLLDRLRALGRAGLPAPLVKLTGDQTSLRDTEARLTEFGQRVLEGKDSYHPANPIDEWIGGVHLSSADGRLWFLEDGKLVAP